MEDNNEYGDYDEEGVAQVSLSDTIVSFSVLFK